MWNRATVASRKLADYFNKGGGVVGYVYDDKARAFDSVKEYINAWTRLLEDGDPSIALCNTVEVQSLSGQMIGLIVLPMHPLRVAWHAAYDNLVLHATFEQGQKAKTIRDELQCLDGAMFPAFLPNLEGGSFVFTDTLGFHAVGMVPRHGQRTQGYLGDYRTRPGGRRVNGRRPNSRGTKREGRR